MLRSLTLLIVTLSITATAVRASLEPAPVTLTWTATGAVALGKPLVVNLTVENRESFGVAGEITVTAAPGLRVVARPAGPVGLVPRGRQSVSLALVPERAGTHEVDLAYSAGGPELAVERLFVQIDAAGGRVVGLREVIAGEATRTVAAAGAHAVRLFPMRPARGGTVRTREGGALSVTGVLTYAAYRGEAVPGRRITAELWAEVGGRREKVASSEVGTDGRFTLAPATAIAAGAKVTPVFSLATPRWTISGDDKTYAWEAPALTALTGDTDLGTLAIPADQAAAEACWIHGTLNRALDLFQSLNIDIAWWPSIPINWPASGDFFDYSAVNLTKAFQWDVVGHEFGHAIFHYGSQASGGGGQHKIDECYSKGLAWSEGWASWFSCVVNQPRDAEDAKFEFMVPRRAPIRVENVPADVCQGDTNEWRVSAALWDIYDTHVDGDDVAAVDFPTMWKAMREGGHMGEVRKYFAALYKVVPAADVPAIQRAIRANTLNP